MTELNSPSVLQAGNSTDYELIELMVVGDDTSLLAWDQFHARHVCYVYNMLMKRFRKSFDSMCIQDLTAEALYVAYEKIGTFRFTPDLRTSDQRRHVRAWLGRIAQNLVIAEFRKHEGIELVYADDVDKDGHDAWGRICTTSWVGPGEDDPSKYDKNFRMKELVSEALRILTDDERRVLEVTIDFEVPGREFQRLPNRISKELADSLGTSPENVRQLRHRAKRKIKTFVEQRMDSSK